MKPTVCPICQTAHWKYEPHVFAEPAEPAKEGAPSARPALPHKREPSPVTSHALPHVAPVASQSPAGAFPHNRPLTPAERQARWREKHREQHRANHRELMRRKRAAAREEAASST